MYLLLDAAVQSFHEQGMGWDVLCVTWDRYPQNATFAMRPTKPFLSGISGGHCGFLYLLPLG